MNFCPGPYIFPKGFLQIVGIVVFITGSISLYSQQYYARNFTIDDGLPCNTVRAVFKDSRRILWIGTSAGLTRFNGREFTVYNSSNGLAAENIFDITEDNKGNLWIGGMGGGISMFDGKKFTNYTTREGLVCNDVRRVWWSKKFNILLVGTNKGFSAFDGNFFYSLSASAIHSKTETYFVLGFIEKQDCIEAYAYGMDQVYNYYPASHQIKKVPEPKNYHGSLSCSPVVGKKGDTIWGWGRNGIQIRNRGVKASFDSLGQVFHMAADDEKNIWIAAWAEPPVLPIMPGGLFRYDGEKIIPFSKSHGISDPGVWAVSYDSVFHVLWVGTLHQGLYRMPLPCFEWYGPSWFGLSSMKINDIHSDRYNNLWIATSRGIFRKNGDQGFIVYPRSEIKLAHYEANLKFLPLLNACYLDKDGSFEKYEKLIAERKYPYPNPYGGVSDEFGTDDTIPSKSLYDPAVYSRIMRDLLKNKHDTTAICYHGIEEDSHHNIYISGGFGLIRFKDGDRGKIPEVIPVIGHNWVFAFDRSDTLYGSSSWNVTLNKCAIFPEIRYPKRHFYLAERDNSPDRPSQMISRGDEIWSTSRIGGLYLTMGQKNYAFCKSDTTLPKSINDVCFDGEHNVIAGANNGEVLIFTLEGDNLKVLFRMNGKDGIIGKSIRWVQTDRHRVLYIGSNAGLNLVDLNKLFATGKAEVRFYSRETGYFNANADAAVVDTSGDLWIAADHELCRINRKLLFKNPSHKVKLMLTGMEINNTPLDQLADYEVDPWFGSPTEMMKFSHEQNNLKFSFDVLNYLDADRQQFRYRLLPAIENWSLFSADRTASFVMLQPGRYIFEIESYNPIDYSQVSRLSYQFIIRPPFYHAWWFILLVVILLIGISISAWRLRMKQVRRQEKIKAEISLELNNREMKALKAQMNPHFIFNALNSIQSYILTNNVDKALYYLSMFSKLVRKTLENASKEFVPLGEELEFLNFYIELEKMRFEGQFTNRMECDEDLPLDTTMIPPMIVQPFVENAIKHGLLKLKVAGVLRILVKKVNENQYRVIIEDNGIGRKKAGELKKKEGLIHNSIGIDITNTRIRLLNESGKTGNFSITMVDLFDAEGNAAGTRVEVNLPLG